MFTRDAEDGVVSAYPDTLVGTDSHTTMINGLGVLGWGVGGIEAEAAMLGQPVSMLIPKVVGFKLTGELPAGATATDLVLTVTELLRKQGVVGKFVEFYGPGVSNVPLADRATIGNMSPEYGSTCAIFPVDEETLSYLRLTGRPAETVALVEAYAKAQGMWHDPSAEPRFSERVELDLSTVVPSLAGPKRPQDRVPLDAAKAMFRTALADYASPTPVEQDREPGVPPTATAAVSGTGIDEASAESFPASDPAAPGTSDPADAPAGVHVSDAAGRPSNPVPVTLASGDQVTVDHGHVAIAAITSCTNTSNPYVMVGAGLLAKNAVERGPHEQAVGQDDPRARLEGRHRLLRPGRAHPVPRQARVPDRRLRLHHLHRQQRPAARGGVSAAVNEGDLAVVSVLSGNRNFEGRINPDIKMNYLASPPLVVAYALAGSMDVDITSEPLGTGSDGEPVYLRDIWPSAQDVAAVVGEAITSDMYASSYADVFAGTDRWQAIDVPAGETFSWDPESTYVRKPPYFDGMEREPKPLTDITGAKVLAKLGDSVTTDHISPAGSIRGDSPAGTYLQEHGVTPKDFNSYGSRRGNHEVMIRGTFANIRLRNQLAPGTEGGFTVKDGSQTSIYEASQAYQAEGTPLVILAGKEYGSGSSRDWAAKGTALLGVRAVIAESYERIHRSNLIGMGVLPLQYAAGDNAESLGLTGSETFTIEGIAGGGAVPRELTVRADEKTFTVTVRIDTPGEQSYYANGGIMQFVLRSLLTA